MLLFLVLISIFIDFFISKYIKIKFSNYYIIFSYIFISLLSIYFILIYNFFKIYYNIKFFRNFLIPLIIISYFYKLLYIIIIFFLKFFFLLKKYKKILEFNFFLPKALIIINIAPIIIIFTGIISGAYDYELKKIKINLKKLPKSFHGLKIGHLSDIHSGSLFNKIAIKGGIEILMNQCPDIIFFTGDLVNYQTNEIIEYINIFKKINAPLGVYSVLGNHDYGDYIKWNSLYHKYKNFLNMIKIHKLLGWKLMINENKIIKKNKNKIAIIGVENWGIGKFPKYGNLKKAYHKINRDIDIKLLLSHDPSHWDDEIRPFFNDIDITFSGHTHGFQFGIELNKFKWSPAQYKYKQWSGLYKKKSQYIYVNKGFGYIGYPGRVGMLPELTIIELEKN